MRIAKSPYIDMLANGVGVSGLPQDPVRVCWNEGVLISLPQPHSKFANSLNEGGNGQCPSSSSLLRSEEYTPWFATPVLFFRSLDDLRGII